MASPARPRRTRHGARAHTTAKVPNTIWPAGAEPLDPADPWPAPVVSRAIDEFTEPGDHVAMLTIPHLHSTDSNTAPQRRRYPRCPSAPSATVATIGHLGRTALQLTQHSTSRWRGFADLVLSSIPTGQVNTDTLARTADIVRHRQRAV